MATATANRWRNATPAAPCPICGKGDWCTFSTDGGRAYCRRSTDSPVDPSFVFVGSKTNDSGEFFDWKNRDTNGYHEPHTHEQIAQAEQPAIASIETRHKVYSLLLNRLPCVTKSFAEKRGVPVETFHELGYRQYGQARAAAVRALIEAGHESDFESIPGFYIAEKNGRRFWSIAGAGGTVIPSRDINGNIQGLRVRHEDTTRGKYSWISSKTRGGTSPGTPAHHPLFDGDTSTVRITEGECKSDIATLKSCILTIGLPSVVSWKNALPSIQELGASTVLVAFDADQASNRDVARSMLALLKSLREDESITVVVEIWDGHKGIDDALVNGAPIRQLVGDDLDQHMDRLAKVAASSGRPPADRNGTPTSEAPPPGDDLDRLCSQEPLTEFGNRDRLIHRFGREMSFCHTWRNWLVWDGRRWSIDNQGAAHANAQRMTEAILDERKWIQGDDDRKAHLKWAAASEQVKMVNNALQLARAHLPIEHNQLDANPWLLNVPNGTLDLQSGILREHRREDHITKLCATPYDSAAACPLWESTLEKILGGNGDLVVFVQRLFGMALSGDVSQQVLPILWGDGANGKSLLLNVMLDILGEDYASSAADELLTIQKGDAHPTIIADLFGKRLVVAIETDASHRLSESLVKKLTGADKIKARRMREDFWAFTPTHKLILCTNHRPEVRGQDFAVWRRLRLVPFTTTFWDPDDPRNDPEALPPELRQDKRLPDKLRAEFPGILAWLVRGCLEWQKHGLGEPECVTLATEDFRSEQDVLGAFLAERCFINSQVQVKSSAIYEAYREWTEKAGEYTQPQRKFGRAMTEKGFERKKNSDVWYVGIALKSEEMGD